jgi:hypothetical protein
MEEVCKHRGSIVEMMESVEKCHIISYLIVNNTI